MSTEKKKTSKMKDLLQSKVSNKFIKFLSQGISPKQLALSVTIGAILGYFPILGVTTFICIFVSLNFRFNLPAMLLANYSMYPVQIFLIIPLLRLGEFIFQVEPLPLQLEYISDLFAKDFLLAIRMFGLSLLRASIAWFLISIPAALPLFLLLHWIFSKTKRTLDTEYSEN